MFSDYRLSNKGSEETINAYHGTGFEFSALVDFVFDRIRKGPCYWRLGDVVVRQFPTSVRRARLACKIGKLGCNKYRLKFFC